jgi:hypothetical protein
LEGACDSTPINDTKGNSVTLNAKDGKEMEYEGCTGANSLDNVSDDSGER